MATNLVQDNFLACLEMGDVDGCVEIMKMINPHLPPSENPEATMHATRTVTERISLRARAYSHRWLLDRNLPSMLPDNLKPQAERLYPRIVAGVGVAVDSHSSILRPVAREVERAICDAIETLHADGVSLDSPLVKIRMREAHDKTLKLLLGIKK